APPKNPLVQPLRDPPDSRSSTITGRVARPSRRRERMRAREPDAAGYVDLDGVKLHYEVFGDGEPTLLLLPAWTIVHTGTGRAVLVSLSMGAQWALWVTAHHPER